MLGLVDKINRYGGTSIRTEIWREYILGVLSNAGNFIFGADTSNVMYHWLSFYSGNTHNSFLMLHAKFGIVALLMVIILLFVVLHKSIQEKNYIMMVTVIVAIARMFFDWISFPGLYDILFWYMFLYALDKEEYGRQLKEQLQ